MFRQKLNFLLSKYPSGQLYNFDRNIDLEEVKNWATLGVRSAQSGEKVGGAKSFSAKGVQSPTGACN